MEERGARARGELTVTGMRHRLRLATSWEIRDAASAALDAGLYSPALAEAAVFADSGMSDIGPAFDAAIDELGLAVPAETDECSWALLRHHIGEVARGVLKPCEGVKSIVAGVYYGCSLDRQVKAVLGDSHGIELLVGAYYEYADLHAGDYPETWSSSDRDAALEALDLAVVSACRSWLERHER